MPAGVPRRRVEPAPHRQRLLVIRERLVRRRGRLHDQTHFVEAGCEVRVAVGVLRRRVELALHRQRLLVVGHAFSTEPTRCTRSPCCRGCGRVWGDRPGRSTPGKACGTSPAPARSRAAPSPLNRPSPARRRCGRGQGQVRGGRRGTATPGKTCASSPALARGRATLSPAPSRCQRETQVVEVAGDFGVPAGILRLRIQLAVHGQRRS